MMVGLISKLNIDFSCTDLFDGLLAIMQSKNRNVSECTIYLNHARTGLGVALKALQLPKGSKVGIVAYNCHSVMNAVYSCGFDIVFIDIDENLNLDLNDLRIKSHNISALIVTHLFGNVNNINQIREITNNIPIIEDCAHAFMSKGQDNEAGKFGDISVFSIGQGKFPAVGDGGYMYVNNDFYSKQINHEVSKLKHFGFVKEILNLLRNLALSFFHNPIIYKYISKPYLKKGVTVVKKSETHGLMLKSNYKVLKKRLCRIDFDLKSQREFTAEIIKTISNSKLADYLRFSIDLDYSNCFMFPVLVKEEYKDRFVNYFYNKGIEITGHLALWKEWALEFDYVSRSCPNAEKISQLLHIIPCHYHLSERQRKQILKSIEAYE